MKVLIVTRFPADTNRPNGGVEAVSLALVRGLLNERIDALDVVTLCNEVATETKSAWNGAEVYRIPTPAGSELRVSLNEGRRLIQEKIAQLKPDIVHSHDTYGLMASGVEVPSVFTVHGFIHGDILVSGGRGRRIRSYIWRYFETKGWRQQKNIISISPYVRERLHAFYQGRIYDIDNPIDESFFNIRRDIQKGRVFSSAAICRRKNQLALIQAVHRLRDTITGIQLHMAGKITELDYYRVLENYIVQNDLEDCVQFLGQISTDQIKVELAKCAVFALTSREENSPMGIEEAMAVGIPIVTSNKCGMPYMVRHEESGYLVDCEDVEEIAQKVGIIIKNDDLAADFEKGAQKVAISRFHPEVVAKRTVSAYREIIDRAK